MKINTLLEDRADIRVRLDSIDRAIDAGVRDLLRGQSPDTYYLAALKRADFVLAATIARYCWHQIPPNTLAAHLWANRLRDCEACMEMLNEDR